MPSNRLPEFGYVRLKQILGDPKADPPCPAIIPVSRTTWYQGIKDGHFPKPIKLTPTSRRLYFRRGEVRSWVAARQRG